MDRLLVLLGLTAAVLIISAGLGQRFIPPWDVAKTFLVQVPSWMS